MVETNGVELIDTKGDLVDIFGENDFTSTMIEGINGTFGKLSGIMKDRMDELDTFKEVVRKRLIIFMREAELFKEMFRKFDND